eukprot:scaffold140509_cov37-Prasinocladus_malaysianus.AAC.1
MQDYTKAGAIHRIFCGCVDGSRIQLQPSIFTKNNISTETHKYKVLDRCKPRLCIQRNYAQIEVLPTNTSEGSIDASSTNRLNGTGFEQENMLWSDRSSPQPEHDEQTTHGLLLACLLLCLPIHANLLKIAYFLQAFQSWPTIDT